MPEPAARLSWTLVFNWAILAATILVSVGQQLLASPLVADVPELALWVTRAVTAINLVLRYTTTTATVGILGAAKR